MGFHGFFFFLSFFLRKITKSKTKLRPPGCTSSRKWRCSGSRAARRRPATSCWTCSSACSGGSSTAWACTTRCWTCRPTSWARRPTASSTSRPGWPDAASTARSPAPATAPTTRSVPTQKSNQIQQNRIQCNFFFLFLFFLFGIDFHPVRLGLR